MTTGSDIDAIDLSDLDHYADGPPWELFRTLRREAPVHWNPLPGGEPGFWSVTRFEDIARVAQDSATFSSGTAGVFLRDEQVVPWEVASQVLLNQDPPQHTKTRGIVQKVFTAAAVASRTQSIRTVATKLIDGVIEGGEADLVADVAVELPVRAIADMLGIPRADQPELAQAAMRIGVLAGADEDAIAAGRDAAMADFIQIGMYLFNLVQERRVTPTDDLISRLALAEVDGQVLDDVALTGFVAFLLSAGSEETRNTYSGGMRALIEHPEQRQLLLADPSLIPNAVEELLRWHSAIIYQRRTTTCDTEIRGTRIAAGEKVVMWLPSGNRDENAFERPDELDVRRPGVKHQAFGGGGRHFCIGNQLARLQLRILFEETLRRLPDMELAGPVEHQRSNFFHGITRMPVTFSPDARSS